MAEFIATTLSELHIGSGQTLIKNLDFAIGTRKNKDNEIENVIGVLDIKKIAKLIGPENIEKLINFIDQKGEKNILDFFKSFKQDVELEKVSKRRLSIYGDFSNKNELKEFLLNSDGNPIIPGSSLKGAIRTAIISHLVNQNKNIVRGIIDNERNYKFFAQWEKEDFQKVETKILNKLLSGSEFVNANKNVMRFLQVGDIEFPYETIAVVLEILNFYYSGWDIKKGQSSLIEVISQNCESEPFKININETLLNINKEKKTINAQTDYLESLQKIFEIVNNHTKKIIENEIKFWKNQNSNIDKTDSYLSRLKEILEAFKNLNKEEMIIRLGGNSGWTSITGGWAKEIFSEMEWDKLYHLLNKNRKVKFFPKTRKIDHDGKMFGFVKITKQNN